MDDLFTDISIVVVWTFAVSVFGVTWLLRFTLGPWGIFMKLRELTGIQYIPVYDINGDVTEVKEDVPEGKQLAEMFSCFWCLSTWVSLALIFVVLRHITPSSFILLWTGSIGMAGFMYEFISVIR